METVREVSVPARLQDSPREDVYEWARNELNGEEPDLSQTDVDDIRDGKVKKIELKPKKEGFFLPNGEFVEAYDHAPSFGEELEDAESKWAQEERDREWVDEENERFNKTAVDDETRILEFWRHGKRLHQYLEEEGRPPYTIKSLLARRAGPKGYGRWAHKTALNLYRWRPDASPDSTIFGWTWGLVDALLQFSDDHEIRDRARQLIEDDLLPAGISESVLTEFFRGPSQSNSDIWAGDTEELTEIYSRLSRGKDLEDEALAKLVKILAPES